VSYAVSPIKIATPTYEIIQYIISLARNQFTIEAMINPKRPIIKKLRHVDRSFLVMKPYIDTAANVPAVMKKTLAIDSAVKTRNIDDNVIPVTTEYAI
jgi:hypothetical protein